MNNDKSIELGDEDDEVKVLESPTPGTRPFPDCESTFEKSDKSTKSKKGDRNDETGSSKRIKSDVWHYFETPETIHGVERCKCKNCPKYLSCKSTSGTTHLRRHVDSCLKSPKFQDMGAMFDMQSKLMHKWKFDANRYREKLARAIIKHDLPFCDCMKVFVAEKDKLKRLLGAHQGRICLTSDVWTAVTTVGYMSVTSHFIDENWELNSKLLSFVELDTAHSGLELSDKLLDVLKDWGISSKLFSITLDNATSNDSMVRFLKSRLNLQNGLLCEGEFFHVRCSAHILNLIVQEGLKVVENALKMIRNSVKYVKASDGRIREFQKCIDEVNLGEVGGGFLRLDVPTRWNSMYLMLESAIKYRRAFTSLSFNDTNYKYCPTNEEWDRASKIREFLEPFYTMTNMISGSSYPTSNLYFRQVAFIEMKLNELSVSDDGAIKDMASRMKVKFDKYWNEYCATLAFGSILDPNSKLKFLNFCYKILYPNDFEEKVKKVRDSMYKLFREYDRVDITSSLSTVAQSQLQQHTSGTTYEEMYQQQLMEEDSNGGKNELDMYLDEGFKANSIMRILEYWKLNALRFPRLARMASDILSIPITTVASESTFSIGGGILHKYRSCLLSETVQALICTRNWLHGFKEAKQGSQEDQEEVEEISLSQKDSTP